MRFLLIEDHPLMRTGLRQYLSRACAPCTFEEAETAAAAMPKLNARWDLIFLDIDLPDRSGIDLLEDICRLSPRARVLVFSGQSQHEFGKRVLQAGAMGYLPKGSSSEVVIEAVKQVLAGKRYLTSELASTLIGDALDPGKELPHQTLSEREFEVLRLYGKGCTPSQIAHRLGLSIKTISTHRTRILAKLQLETTGEMVRYAVQQKLV